MTTDAHAGFSEFSPDAILTRQQVAAWLAVHPRQVERLGVPCLALGRKTVRYLARDVKAWLEARRRGPLHARRPHGAAAAVDEA